MKVKEIFYSLQGEGRNTGRPAVFIRFAGCNLKCPFCDTDFNGGDEMSENEIVDAACRLSTKCHFAVLTGGEPTIQATVSLIDKLQQNGFEVAIETNGTRQVPYNVNWVTVSPKVFVQGGSASELRINRCDELKLVFDGVNEPSDYNIHATHYYLQPCDTGNAERNKIITEKCINFIKLNPKWKLSLQTHKLLNIQ